MVTKLHSSVTAVQTYSAANFIQAASGVPRAPRRGFLFYPPDANQAGLRTQTPGSRRFKFILDFSVNFHWLLMLSQISVHILVEMQPDLQYVALKWCQVTFFLCSTAINVLSVANEANFPILQPLRLGLYPNFKN